MSDRVRIVVYYGALIIGLLLIHRLIGWLNVHADKALLLRGAVLIALVFLWALSWMLYQFWWSIRDSSARPAWMAVVDYALAAIWIALVGVLHVAALRVLFGVVPMVDPSRPIQRPTGPGVAAFGLFILLVSCSYLVLLVLNRDSFWTERFVDLRVFVIGFLAGSYILLASRVPEKLLGPAFGESLLGRFEASIGDDPKYSLLVVIPAAILASVITILHSARKD